MGDGPLPDHRLIQAQIVVNLPALPLNRHIHHHPPLRHKPLPEPVQQVQFRRFQFRDKAQAPHVHPQHRRAVQGRQFRKMQNGPVAAEGHQQRRVPQFRRQGAHRVIPQKLPVGFPEGGAYHRGKPQGSENAVRLPGGLHVHIPVGIGAEDNLFGVHGRSSPSKA